MSTLYERSWCYIPGVSQDTWVIHEGLGGGSNALFAVFDGHGVEGEKCSRHVAGQLPSMLAHCAKYKVLRWRAQSVITLML